MTTAPGALLPDGHVRSRIQADLGTTLFVSAGAGSGKTTQLVDRVVALVKAGVPIDAIAAITFTEKAADELRHRIRLALETGALAGADPDTRLRCTTARDELDRAACCTLHAFAQRLLTAYPLEAGLPPAVTVMDEIASDLDFDERFQAFYGELATRPDLERAMTLAVELGITRDHLRSVAERFDDNWDRLAPPVGKVPDPPPLDATPLLQAGRQLLATCDALGGSDRLAECLSSWLPGWLEQVARAASPGRDELDLLDLLTHPDPPSLGNLGRAAPWASTPFETAKGARQAAKGLVDRTVDGGVLARVLGTLVEPVLARLGREIARFTLQEAARRSRRGRLTFHDLLVLCRRLVRHPHHGERVRAELGRRFQAILVDEYQDTDPLQLDIVVAIATPPGQDEPRAGQLFFVGDPKQSLYRFRRADIDLFLRTPALVGAAELSLTTNFRSTPGLIAWINHVFSGLISHAETDDGRLAQPRFEPLDPQAAPPMSGPPVTVVGVDPHPRGTRVGELREVEAADIAAVIGRVQAERWQVRGRDGDVATARLSDIAVLIPARTALGQLEAALRVANIPYRLDTGSLVYAADEIRALLLALRAIDDPSDDLALVSVLRSPLYGCSDVELYRWRREREGRWNPLAPRPPRREGDDTVWDALADLERRVSARAWLTPSQQLDSLVRDRRVLETALAGPSPMDAWHRVRFVIEQARGWSDAGGRFLRDYLDWTRRQTGLTGRVAEAVLEQDSEEDQAVRVLTVHGSKGLEFPITIVCGFNSPPGGRRRGVEVSFGPAGDATLRLRDGLEQQGFDASRAIDEQMDDYERIRLLYVACTRARDHLVVSLHRTDDTRLTGARLLADRVTDADGLDALAGIQDEQPDQPGAVPHGSGGRAPEVLPRPAPSVSDLARWRSDRAALVATARLPRSMSATGLAATALADVAEATAGEAEDDDRFVELAGVASADDSEPGLAKRPVDLDLPAWRKGRYGTAVGRAVHAVLQVVDLETGEGIDALAGAQAAAEGIEGEEARIAALARSALAAPCVREAVASEHWREVYVGVPVRGTVLEGYIDLLYRRPDGLVVVDHKTDRVETDEALAGKLAAYRLQLAAYALAIERATGERVVDARLVFCGRDGATEAPVADLRAAIAEAEALASANRSDPRYSR